MASQHVCIPDGRLRNCLRGVRSGRHDQVAVAARAVSCSMCHGLGGSPTAFSAACSS